MTETSGNDPHYMIRLVRNPYRWGAGDFYNHPRNRAELDYWVGQYTDEFEFPDLSDDTLHHRGYPGYPYLEMRVYEIKEIEV